MRSNGLVSQRESQCHRIGERYWHFCITFLNTTGWFGGKRPYVRSVVVWRPRLPLTEDCAVAFYFYELQGEDRAIAQEFAYRNCGLLNGKQSNGVFAVRNSPGGLHFLQLWLKIGVSDNGASCEHNWGTFYYHDLAFWMLVNMIWSGLQSDCIDQCAMKSLFLCNIGFTEILKQARKWPTLASVKSGQWKHNLPPVIFGE
eukprot:m.306560 g.306560  ORF g.306560 m.306560 type:complete len:200 (+) comp16352_c0_seq1:2195-2794(+)